MDENTIGNDAMVAKVKQCLRDPVLFFREILGVEPWSRQIEIGEAIHQTRRREALKKRRYTMDENTKENEIENDAMVAKVREVMVVPKREQAPAPAMTITITTFRENESERAITRRTLEAQCGRFYSDLHWRTEDGARGKIDRLLGRPKR